MSAVVLCEHYACRCARAEELMQMADFYGSARLAHEAVLVHEARVRCRLLDPGAPQKVAGA